MRLSNQEKEIISLVKDTLCCESLHTLPDFVYEEVVLLLRFFQYKITEQDVFFFSMSLLKVNQRICDFCNVSSLQASMYRKYAIAVVGEFLWGVYHARKTSTEDIENDGFPFEEVVTLLQEGDVKVSFDAKESSVVRFFKLLKEMRSIENHFLQYRKLRW